MAITRCIFTLSIAAIILIACAPKVRQELAETVDSLPAAPPGAVLLGQRQGSLSGSTCPAYYADQVYGSYQPMAELVQYYDRALVKAGWKSSQEFTPGAGVAAELMRSNDEFVEILSDKFIYFDSAATSIPPTTLGQYSTVYVLRVMRSCGQ